MVNTLSGSVCAYRKETVKPRFIRIDEVMALLDVTQDEAMDIALAAGARYQLAKIILVHKERLMKFMKHSARVPSSNKIVEKKFVRIGEGSMTYSIGHHRFIEMARAAGAVYKIGEAKGNTRATNLTQVTEYYKNNTVSKQNSTEKTKDAQANAAKIKSSEDKLSSKAQKYLETLRKDNADFDFIIADKGDDFRGLVDQSDKEFTVVFSSAELERMASDEKYAQEKLSMVKTAVVMSDKINEQFGFERAWGKTENNGTVLSKLTMSFDDSGKMTLFADLEKITEKQQEWLEELKEKRAEEKQQEKKDLTVKRTTIQANSEEELIEKISELDWSKIAEEKATQGMKFDTTI